MSDRADQGGRVAIIGLACRFPGAGDPAEFHDLTAGGQAARVFPGPAAGSRAGLLHAALLDDWSLQAASGDPAGQDAGAVQKLAAETTALALADAGLKADEIVAGAPGRAGLSIASSTAGVGELVREQSGLTGDAAWPSTAAASSLHTVAAAAEALRAGNLDLAVAGGAELGPDPAWLTAAARAGTLGRDEMRVYAAEPAACCPVRAAASWCSYARLTPTSRGAHLRRDRRLEHRAGLTIGADDRAILQAYQQASIDPADIQLIEGEGRAPRPGTWPSSPRSRDCASRAAGPRRRWALWPRASGIPGQRQASRA